MERAFYKAYGNLMHLLPQKPPPENTGGGFGWAGEVRTHGCGSQSPVPYHLATAHLALSVYHLQIDMSIIRTARFFRGFFVLRYFCVT